MPRSVIGLDIGTAAVRAAELRGDAPPTLARFAQVALPPGAVVNGEIVEEEIVAAVIRDLWDRGEFRRKRVSVAVANPSVVVRQVEISKVPEEDLKQSLPFQVADYIPFASDDAMLDYLLLDEFAADDGHEMLRILIVAAQRQMVNKVVRVVRQAGLEPLDIDLAPLAAVRALIDEVPPVLAERQAVAAIDIGAGVTSIVVCERGLPRFVRVLSLGGADITAALSATLGMPPDVAEQQKALVGLGPEGAPVEPGARATIEERARLFIEDVRASIAFYGSQPNAAPLGNALLTGGGALLPGLRERIQSALGVRVDSADALWRVKIGDLGLSDEQLEHVRAVAAVAVGLGMEG